MFKLFSDKSDDVIEKLPSEGIDAAGQKITFHYELQPDNTLLVSTTDEHGHVRESWWSDSGKCAAGAIGRARGLWGAGAGLVGGGIAGGISVGFCSKATFC